MEKYQVDLTNCDREPIHIPGKVQSHGFLVAVDIASHNLSYISENTKTFIGTGAKNYLGKPITALEQILNIKGPEGQLSLLLSMGSSKNFDAVNPYHILLADEPYFVIITPSGNNLILEFEPADSDLSVDVQKTIGRSISEYFQVKTWIPCLTTRHTKLKRLSSMIG